MDTSFGEIDMQLFVAGRERELEEDLAFRALLYMKAGETVASYERAHDPELIESAKREVQEMPVFQDIQNLLGPTIAESISVTPIYTEEDISDKTYAEAKETRSYAETFFVGFVTGFQAHIAKGLRDSDYSADDDELLETSWKQAWSALKKFTQPVGGTALAEIGDFFDGLVRLRHESYDPVDRLRGLQGSKDIAARMFYEVFEDNIARAIQRSGDDNWTGH